MYRKYIFEPFKESKQLAVFSEGSVRGRTKRKGSERKSIGDIRGARGVVRGLMERLQTHRLVIRTLPFSLSLSFGLIF